MLNHVPKSTVEAGTIHYKEDVDHENLYRLEPTLFLVKSTGINTGLFLVESSEAIKLS